MKKVLLKGLIAVCFLSFSVHAQSYRVTFANYFGEDHPNTLMLQNFKEKLEQNSNGLFKVQLEANNSLGGEEVIMNLVKKGTIQMAQVGALIKSDEPMLANFEQPFVIDNWEHGRRVFLNPEIKKFTGDYTKYSGARIEGIVVNGFREISSSVPIDSIDDFNNIKIRTPLNEVFFQFFKALGTKAYPMPATELYTALKNKEVDGQDNPFTMFYSMKWYEVNKYVLESRHIFSPTFILVNDKWYQNLDAEAQAIFDKTLSEAILENWSISEQKELETIAKLKELGVTITKPSSEFKNELIKATLPVYDWFDREIQGSREFRDYCKGLR